MKEKDDLKNRIRSLGYRLTKQREAILEVLEMGDQPLLTAQQLFKRVVKKNPGINFSTVYRNLEILVQEGIILQLSLGGDVAYYELNKKGDHHHHHLVCKECGKVRRTEYCPFENMPQEQDFIPTEHRFEIFGYCRDCTVYPQDKKAKSMTRPEYDGESIP